VSFAQITCYFTLYTNCPGGMTDAVARRVSFAQITCYAPFKKIVNICITAYGDFKAWKIIAHCVYLPAYFRGRAI